MKIWDAHSHWMPPEVAGATSFFKQGWSDINLLLKNLDENGIEKAVLLYPTSDAHIKLGGWAQLSLVYNRLIADQVKAHPDRLIGAGILAMDKPENILREIARIKDLGLSCLSLASSYAGKYLDEENLLPALEQAEKEQFPVFVHAQIINPIGFERVKDPLLMPVVEYLFDVTMCAGKLMMSGVLNRLRGLKIVFAHFAGVLPFLSDRFDATYAMLRSRDIVKDLKDMPTNILRRIFVDISGAREAAIFNLAMDFFGSERILWGSDFPAKGAQVESIAMVRSAGVSEKEKERILSGNLIDLFRR
jgi:predicted TIM-barrel fold metal-dependent hydrolase